MKVLFSVCFYLKVLIHCNSKAMIIFRHPYVENLYTSLKDTFTGEDPFANYDRLQRKQLCDELLKSRVYSLTDNEDFINLIRNPHHEFNKYHPEFNFQKIGYEEGLSEEILKYKERSVEVGSTPARIKMFACNLSQDPSMYLSYGFRPNHAFIVTTDISLRPDTFGVMKLHSVLEPDPEFDKGFWHPRDLMNDYFWNTLMKGETANTSTRPEVIDVNSTPADLTSPLDQPATSSLAVPSEMELHSLSEHQHFRLCGSVANELAEISSFHLEVKKHNFIYPRTGVSNQRKGIMKDDHSTTVYANVLPCAINRKWENPQFYLLRNPNEAASVFVFRSIEEAMYGQVLRLEARMDEMMVLYE